jgi:hypothetical protein
VSLELWPRAAAVGSSSAVRSFAASRAALFALLMESAALLCSALLCPASRYAPCCRPPFVALTDYHISSFPRPRPRPRPHPRSLPFFIFFSCFRPRSHRLPRKRATDIGTIPTLLSAAYSTLLYSTLPYPPAICRRTARLPCAGLRTHPSSAGSPNVCVCTF